MQDRSSAPQAVITPAEIAALVARGQGRGFAPGLPGGHSGTMGGIAAEPTAFRAADFATAARVSPAPQTEDSTPGTLAAETATPAPQPRPALSFAEAAPPAPPRDIEAELAAARAEGRSEGHAAGLVEGRALALAEHQDTAESDLAQARALFMAAVTALAAPDPASVRDLEATLAAAVARLAADRAGMAIADHPEAFLARIALLADRVAQGSRAITLTLHPADLAAINAHLPGPLPQPAAFATDAALSRGDILIRAGGVTLADLLAEGVAV